MQSRWSPAERLELIDYLASLSGSATESFFDAHDLGSAYRLPGRSGSKRARINAALHGADVQERLESIFDAAASYFGWVSAMEADTQATEGAGPDESDVLPRPETDLQRLVLQTIWDEFYPSGAWPTFTEVDRQFDRATGGQDIEDASRTLPAGLTSPPRIDPTTPEGRLRLTVAGASACAGAAEDLTLFVSAVGLAATIERELGLAGGAATPTLDSATVRSRLDLPNAPSNEAIARLGQFLAVENWGWQTHNKGDEPSTEWTFTIQRSVRRLRGVASVTDYWQRMHPELTDQPQPAQEVSVADSTAPPSIFLVHGHGQARHEVTRFLERVTGLEIVILDEQANRGRTLLEKFEQHGNAASFAVVLLTPDDVGRAVTSTDLSPRARQNVVFELGYFFGKVGRGQVLVLNQGVEKPSDVDGILYIAYPEGDWKLRVARELTAAGIAVDLSKA